MYQNVKKSFPVYNPPESEWLPSLMDVCNAKATANQPSLPTVQQPPTLWGSSKKPSEVFINNHIFTGTLNNPISSSSSSSSASSILKVGCQLPLFISVSSQPEQLFDGGNSGHSAIFRSYDFFLRPARLFPSTLPIIMPISSGFI